MGYSGRGLEAWAYPFQLFDGYRIQFLSAGMAAIDGDSILRRVEYRPEEIVRTYVGPDFEVREHLFVPLDRPGVILSYEVSGQCAVELRVSFVPVLNLMWPAGLGGQDLNWRPSLSAYEMCEITTAYCALIGSPEASDHTDVVNSTLRQDLRQSMVLHPVNGRAQVFAALEHRPAAEGAELRFLEQNVESLRTGARSHAASLLASGKHIETPDAELSSAITWSKIGLDQAWVCNPQLGCGEVAGYGPSRGMRRPQYAWFFAGDGLVATEALLAAGETARAKEELAFILKYQNASTGMIWHELSQSAGMIDWAGKYPYMFVHVDITFDFLSTLGDYYRATGDVEFVRAHWDSIAKAFDYCHALIDASTGLPRIPAGKEGANEQERMREDVGLSAGWIGATEGFRAMAEATGHEAEARMAASEAAAARHAFTARYWDPQRQFWIAGYNESGAPMTDERSHSGLLGQGLFTAEEENAALTRLASAAFETDWGTRGMSAASAHFDPNSYAEGSVSALGTAAMAEAFWRDHRPAAAWPIFESLLPWFRLDSLGHMHEVAAGDVFHPQIESVPEQTWSTAGFLSTVVHGLLGIDVDAPHQRLELAPHLDPRWPRVTLGPIAVGPAQVTATLEQKPGELDSTLAAHGGRVHVSWAPEIPLGASGVRALVNGKAAPVSIEQHEEDEHVRVEVDLTTEPVFCRILYAGGVRVVAPAPNPAVGDRTVQLKLTGVVLHGDQLTISADVAGGEHAALELDTPWTVGAVDGGSAVALGEDRYRLTFTGAGHSPGAQFVQRRMTVQLRR